MMGKAALTNDSRIVPEAKAGYFFKVIFTEYEERQVICVREWELNSVLLTLFVH